MIRDWISTHTSDKGLQKAIVRMRQNDPSEKVAREGPSKADVGKLVNRLAGGRIQRRKG